MEFDLVIANGTVIDGTGWPRFAADVGLQGGRIAALAPRNGQNPALTGRELLDATGLIVAPGFVDFHSHSDWILTLPDQEAILAPLLLQGVTTLVTGQCGFSPAPVTDASIPAVDAFSEEMRERDFPYRLRSMGQFLAALEGDGLLLNAAFLVGHGTLRLAVLGEDPRGPTTGELDAICRLTRQALEEGAFGLSFGLAYAPGVFARNDEVLTLFRAATEGGGLVTVHGRAYSWVSPLYRPMIGGSAHNLRSVLELLDLGRQSGARLQLSHQIMVGRRTWRTYRRVLRAIDEAAAAGLDVAMDAFPYTVGNTTVKVVFPEWFLKDFRGSITDPRACRKLKGEMDLLRLALGLDYRDILLLWGRTPELAELEGLDFQAIAQRLGLPPFEAYLHVARASEGRARVLLGTYSGDAKNEAPLRAVLSHRLCAFMTDTILTTRGRHNPASFGTFPRILGHYSRDLGLFGLEEAVRRMTGFPAGRLGLEGVGKVAEGQRADLVLFDPATVDARATLARPDAPPAGIHAVLLAGQLVVRDGRLVPGPRRGQVFRR
jgi:N-acyl-D-amino-acid deacylase